jgi:hypothetical protein
MLSVQTRAEELVALSREVELPKHITFSLYCREVAYGVKIETGLKGLDIRPKTELL